MTGSAATTGGTGAVTRNAPSIGTGTGGRFATTAAMVTATAPGAIYLTNAGNETLSVNGASLDASTSGAGSGIAIQTVTVGAGTATLNALGAITSAAGTSLLTAGTANLTGATIGTSSSPLNTAAPTVIVTSTGAVYLANTGAEALTASGASVNASATGAMTGSAATTGGTGAVTLNAASIGTGTGGRFATTAGTVSATSAGAEFLANTGAEALTASGASVDATATGQMTGSAATTGGTGAVTLNAASIGSGPSGRFSTTASTVTAMATGAVFLSSTESETLSAIGSSVDALTSSGDLAAAHVLGQSGNVTLDSAGQLTASAVAAQTGDVSLQAASFVMGNQSGSPGLANALLSVEGATVTINAPSGTGGAGGRYIGVAANNLIVTPNSSPSTLIAVGPLSAGTVSVSGPIGATTNLVTWSDAIKAALLAGAAPGGAINAGTLTGGVSVGTVTNDTGSLASGASASVIELPDASMATNISLFELVDPRLCLPSDQRDDPGSGCAKVAKGLKHAAPKPSAAPAVATTERASPTLHAGGGGQ